MNKKLLIFSLAIITIFGASLSLGVRSASASFTNMYNFGDGSTNSNGANPEDSLIQGSDSNFYGMTYNGGAHNVGVIFKWDGSTYTDVYNFGDGSTNLNGARPYGSLIQGSDSNFYGMTYDGGAHNVGVIFKWDGTNYTDVYDFDNTHGANPHGSLIQATDDNFYGMTSSGGTHSVGVIFKWDGINYTDVYNFGDGGSNLNGGIPQGSLIQATDGKFYGMTYVGGTHNAGVIFKWDGSAYTDVYNFDNIPHGGYPYGSLIQGSDSNFYGMTYNGGAHNVGVIFKWDGTNYTDLYDFDNTHGASPIGSLIKDSGGSFYGMTLGGGTQGAGVIFKWDGSAFTDLFSNFEYGSNPSGSLIQATDGNFYGMAAGGGTHSAGIIFKYFISTDATISVGTLAGQSLTGDFTGGNSIQNSSALTVTIPYASMTSASLSLTKSNDNSSIRYVKNIQPTQDSDYTNTFSDPTSITVADGDTIWFLVTAEDGITKLYYKITVTVVPTEITAFDPIVDIQAGSPGNITYANAEDVINSLPTSVTANSSAVTVPVTTWVDTDTYNPNVVGSYTFTATLGTIPDGFLNTGNFTATVEVVVAQSIYWWNDGVTDANWSTQGNWWTDNAHTVQATSLPDGSENVITLGTVGPNVDLDTWTIPESIDATATGITLTSSNSTILYMNIKGDAIFNGNGQYHYDGTVTRNGTFNDSSQNGGNVTGDATFNGDLAENNGTVFGTKYRRYTLDTYPGPITRNFTGNGAWTVVADGVAVDMTGAIYDNTTTLETRNGGSFITKQAVPISSCPDFENINNNLNGSYYLTKSLDCTGEGSNIMINLNPFTGTFDGRGNAITVAINDPSTNDIGLFQNATGANISNLIINGFVIAGSDYNYVGALVGHGFNLDINNVTNNASVSGGADVGGLVGEIDTNLGTVIINNSHSNGNISGSGSYVGGLVGYIGNSAGDTLISESSTGGTIDGDGYDSTGGLVGAIYNTSGDIVTISGSFSSSIIVGFGSNVGGLVGYIDNEGNDEVNDTTAVNMLNSYHTAGNISGMNNAVGGLIGSAYTDYAATFNLTNSYATGTVSSPASSIGGLIGEADIATGDDGTVNITGNHFSGDIGLATSYNIGGLIGFLNMAGGTFITPINVTISNNYTTGTVLGNMAVGGLIGVGYVTNNSGSFPLNLTISGNHSTSTITGTDSVGGLVGTLMIYNYIEQPLTFTFNQNYAESTVSNPSSVQSDGQLGGLFGHLYSDDQSPSGDQITGTLSEDYFSGIVTDDAYQTGYIGGLIGQADVTGSRSARTLPFTIFDNYAKADVTGYQTVGGLLGWAENVSILRSYASGSVKGNDPNSNIGGGLIGQLGGPKVSITDSFSASAISGFVSSVGAVIGDLGGNTPTLTNTYYDQTLSGQTSCTGAGGIVSGCTPINTGVTGDTTTGDYFKDNSTNPPFTNWNFSTIWRTNTGDYPTLQYFFPIVINPEPIQQTGGTSSGGGSYLPGYGPKATSTTPTPSTPPSGCTVTTLYSPSSGTKCPTTTTTITTPATSYFVFTKLLQIGSRNNEVLQLQKYLNAHGFILAKTGSGSPGNETKYFGKATKQALGLFQLKNKIILKKTSKSFGVFGPATRRFVNKNH